MIRICCPIHYYRWLVWNLIFELIFLRQLQLMAEVDPIGTLMWLRYVAPAIQRGR